jgi:hypothetical protein
MSPFEFVSCRLAIQVRIGHFPDGRERLRTFSVKNIRPDADMNALAALVRAVGAVLACPITRARLVVKKKRVLFGAKAGIDWENDTRPEARGETPARETQSIADKFRTFFLQPLKIAYFILAFLMKISYADRLLLST